MSNVPRPLLKKRADLAYEVQTLENRAQAVREQLVVLDSAIAILSPGWKPPTGPARKRPVKVRHGASGAVARGDVGRESLRVVKEARTALTTTDIATAIAASCGVPFANTADRKRLTSAVLSALRRFEAKQIVELHRGRSARDMRWSIRK